MLSVTKEPNFARYTSDKAIIKDHYYYRGNEFSWNKAARMVEKYYPFYHKQHDDNKGRINKMKEHEDEDKKFIEELKRDKLIEMKAQDKIYIENLAKERTVVQKISKQRLFSTSFVEDIGEEDGRAVYDVISKRVNSGKNVRSDEFKWNLLSLASKKNVTVYLGKYSVKGEEQMIKKIKQRIDHDNKEEDDQIRRRSEKHDKIRGVFLNKHEENMIREEQVVRPVTTKTSLFNTPRATTPGNAGTFLAANKDDQNIKLITGNNEERPNSQSNLINYGERPKIRPTTTSSIDRLAQSREVAKRSFKIDDPDLKGMLVQNMDQKLYAQGNNFYESLTGKSKVFKDILEENRRIKTDSSKHRVSNRPMTSSSNKTINSRPFTGSSALRPISTAKYSSRPDTRLQGRVASGSIETPRDKNNESFQKISSQKPSTQDDINNKQCALEEINHFENTFCRNGKKVGYARVNLEEAYRLTSANGLTVLQKIEAKKLDPLVK